MVDVHTRKRKDECFATSIRVLLLGHQGSQTTTRQRLFSKVSPSQRRVTHTLHRYDHGMTYKDGSITGGWDRTVHMLMLAFSYDDCEGMLGGVRIIQDWDLDYLYYRS